MTEPSRVSCGRNGGNCQCTSVEECMGSLDNQQQQQPSPENAEAIALIARSDKYLNTGSGEYASCIMRDMAEFIRRGIRAQQMRPVDVQIDAAYANGVRACLARLAHLRKPEDDAAWNDCESMWRNRVAERHAAFTSPDAPAQCVLIPRDIEDGAEIVFLDGAGDQHRIVYNISEDRPGLGSGWFLHEDDPFAAPTAVVISGSRRIEADRAWRTPETRKRFEDETGLTEELTEAYQVGFVKWWCLNNPPSSFTSPERGQP